MSPYYNTRLNNFKMLNKGRFSSPFVPLRTVVDALSCTAAILNTAMANRIRTYALYGDLAHAQ